MGTEKYGVIGWPVAHSLSPQLQGAGFAALGLDADYGLIPVEPGTLPATVVRLQADRGHTLIDTGPYAIMRHPGYAGIMVGVLGSGFALNSWWSFVPVALFIAGIFRRLLIEDRFLHEQLEGYPEYARRVQYRLIPGVW